LSLVSPDSTISSAPFEVPGEGEKRGSGSPNKFASVQADDLKDSSIALPSEKEEVSITLTPR
jgi:hypothetical protein